MKALKHAGKRLSSTAEDVQYCGGCSVLWRMFSAVEDVQDCMWIPSSTVNDAQFFGGYNQFCGGKRQVLWR